jgi:DNA-directed RNA polymerase specialized sigma24 family protein
MSERPPSDEKQWMSELKAGNSTATGWVWKQYFTRLMALAQKRMRSLPRRAADEEDVALSALNSFLAGARAGRFPQLENENDLWRLLVTITKRKVSRQRRRHFAARRGGGQERGESAFGSKPDSAAGRAIESVPSQVPTPPFAAEFAEECHILFDRLQDPLLRDIALWKMEGFTNEEIAHKLQRHVRTVERKLALIRDCWMTSD